MKPSSPQPEEYQLVILGSGEAGKYMAWTMATKGMKTALIERKYIGGFRVVRDNLTGENRVTTGRQVPFCILTDPEVARVGLSEREAAERGIGYRLAKLPAVAILRTRTLSETGGFLKALIDAKSDRILGFTAVAVDAGEMLAAVQVAMHAKLPYTALRDGIFTHPTMSDGLIPLFTAVPSPPAPKTSVRKQAYANA